MDDREINFSPLMREHLKTIEEWFSNNEYLQRNWDFDLTINQIIQKFERKIQDPKIHAWIIMYKGISIGYYQDYEIEACDEIISFCPNHSVGIDLFIGELSLYGKGIGTKVIKMISERLKIRYVAIVADPVADNIASIRAFEKAGFKKIGTMKRNAFIHQVMMIK